MNKKLALFISIAVLCGLSACSSNEPEATQSSETVVAAESEATVSETEVIVEETTAETEPVETEPIDPALLEYSLVWEENFDGEELSTDDWNYETHQPGWVNNELQEYVVGDECIWVEDGNLVIQPIEIIDEETGEVSYRSGRINSRRHHDFTYGRIEASIQMPEGQGFLPAFWMMPSQESLYGSWPSCGEIDIAEVVGNAVDTTYGTIHYGIPHNETQCSYTLEDGTTFSNSFHTYAIEWEPGIIRWFIDDVEIGYADRWFTAMTPNNNRPFPKPFDQNFHIILNVAVGGNWPGSPDETTVFDERAQMRVDWIRVYQRGYYDENVELPEIVYEFREADENGNFVAADEWEFMTFNGGVGSADISDDEIVINTENEGEADYAIQLVNAGIPAVEGTTYTVTFEAMADEERQMNVTVSAPEKGYIRYLEDTTLDLTTDWQTYTYTYTIDAESDDNSRLEFNMGSTGSTATIHIRNVVVTQQ